MAKELSEYEQRANDFLAKHEITFEAKFLRHDSMRLDKDNVKRDIYSCVLRRGRHNISVKFGQSIAHSGEWLAKDPNPVRNKSKTFENRTEADAYMSKMGGGWSNRAVKNPNKKAPTAYDMLACLTKSDPGTFDDFCSEFGYSNDSISAKETWQAVREEWGDVRSFFSRDELEEAQEIN